MDFQDCASWSTLNLDGFRFPCFKMVGIAKRKVQRTISFSAGFLSTVRRLRESTFRRERGKSGLKFHLKRKPGNMSQTKRMYASLCKHKVKK